MIRICDLYDLGCVTKSEMRLGPQDFFFSPSRATASNAGMAAIVIRQINADNVRLLEVPVAVESFSFGAHLVHSPLAAKRQSDGGSITALSPAGDPGKHGPTSRQEES